jgi:hypothetical protein
MEVKVLPIAMEAVVGIAMLMIGRGDHERAVELLAFAEAQNVTDKETKDRCRRLLRELEAKVPSDILAAACRRGTMLTVEAVIAQVLDESKS